MKRLRHIPLSLLIVLLLILLPASAAAKDHSTTVLFTHDLHSHFLPQPDGEGGESGGYARLKTALDRERKAHPDALTLDGGGLLCRLSDPDPLYHPGGGAAHHGGPGL